MSGRGSSKLKLPSGVLPKPRAIFKQPFRPYDYVKPKDTGYAEGVKHPKGITREYQPPKVYTIEDRLSKSAAEPKVQLTEEELSKKPLDSQFKIKNAALRRQYLAEIYEKESTRILHKEEKKKKVDEENAKLLEAARKYEQSQAELLTLPTIESYLKGPMVRPRTEEEALQLKLKKEANRLNHEIQVKSSMAEKLLALYNTSSSFAITEEKLEEMVEKAFDNRKHKAAIDSLSYVNLNKLEGKPTSQLFNSVLSNSILGSDSQGPALSSVHDTITGDYKDLVDSVHSEPSDISMNQLERDALVAESITKKESSL